MSRKINSRRKKTKKGIKVGILLLIAFAFISATFFYLLFLKSATTFQEDEFALYIPSSKATPSLVKSRIKSIVKATDYTTFLALAISTGYWNDIKAGKYVISKGSGIFTIFRKLKGGRQTPVTLTLNKYRTKKDLAEYLSGRLEFTTASVLQYMNNSDSLKSLGINNQTLMTIIVPNTYEIYWNISPGAFFNRMKKESERFWDEDRLKKAESIGLTRVEVYNLASIIEEETNDHKEKPLIASVYLNRLKKGMPLGADPTVKFAYGDFSIRRVTLNHINKSASSPYNTYKNKGIPPGPICTPSQKSIDAVLDAEKTDYIFFCAKADFSGSHSFASTEEEHFENARKYRKALDSLRIH
jgi:UPF0755 protein